MKYYFISIILISVGCHANPDINSQRIEKDTRELQNKVNIISPTLDIEIKLESAKSIGLINDYQFNETMNQIQYLRQNIGKIRREHAGEYVCVCNQTMFIDKNKYEAIRKASEKYPNRIYHVEQIQRD